MALIVIDARESGTSTGRYVDKLIEYLAKLETPHQFTLLAKSKRAAALQSLAPNFRVVETPYREFSFGEQLGLRKQINNLRPDMVHFPMVQQPAFYGGRVITTMQDLTTIRFNNPAKNPAIFWFKQQIYKWLNKRVARHSVLLITPSEFVKQDIANYCHVPLDKITVTYESSDEMPLGSTPYEPVEGKPFIMYIGRPTTHKNLDRLIESHHKLRAIYPNLLLVLAGKKDANYRLYENTVKQKGYEGVIFTDFIPDNQFRWLLEHCRAYIFPSLSEGFGLPGLEAMRHGAPVVSSNATCLPEIYGDAALYFDPLSVDDMVAKITTVLSDETQRNNLISAGKQRAASYSWARMAQQTLDVYNRALNS